MAVRTLGRDPSSQPLLVATSRNRASVTLLLVAPRIHFVTRFLARRGLFVTTAALAGISCLLSLAVTFLLMSLFFGGMNSIALVLAIAVPLTCSPIVITMLLRLAAELQQTREQLHRLSITDDLTQAHNRRYFMGVARQEIARIARYGGELSVAIVDLDGFKSINDRHGHMAGDAVLQAVTTACRATVREVDTVARLGGEEFGVLFPGTPIGAARESAERLRERIERTTIAWEGEFISVTASIGVASYREGCTRLEELLRAADDALYGAKASGKNRVITDGQESLALEEEIV